MSIKITPIAGAPLAKLGFAPFYDCCTKSVLYCDYSADTKNNKNAIFRYDTIERRIYAAYIEGAPSPAAYILPIGDCNTNSTKYAVGIGHYTYIINWDGKSVVSTIVKRSFAIDDLDSASRLCVAKPNKFGKFYGGTCFSGFCNATKTASFNMYSREKGVQQIFNSIVSTTGIAYDEHTIYHLDACTKLLTAFDIDCKGDVCKELFMICFSLEKYMWLL